MSTSITSTQNKTPANKYAQGTLFLPQLETNCHSKAESIWEIIFKKTLTTTTVILGLLLATAADAGTTLALSSATGNGQSVICCGSASMTELNNDKDHSSAAYNEKSHSHQSAQGLPSRPGDEALHQGAALTPVSSAPRTVPREPLHNAVTIYSSKAPGVFLPGREDGGRAEVPGGRVQQPVNSPP